MVAGSNPVGGSSSKNRPWSALTERVQVNTSTRLLKIAWLEAALLQPVAATAATLSQFCDAYPRATLHFLTKRERDEDKSLGEIVRISSTSSTSCEKIKGLAE